MCRSLFHQNWQCLRRRREAVSDPFFFVAANLAAPFPLRLSYPLLPDSELYQLAPAADGSVPLFRFMPSSANYLEPGHSLRQVMMVVVYLLFLSTAAA